jgi:hypothetical protein
MKLITVTTAAELARYRARYCGDTGVKAYTRVRLGETEHVTAHARNIKPHAVRYVGEAARLVRAGH